MTDFKNNPAILDNMRTCLVIMAKIKNVKLKHAPGEYDMDTVLNMLTEMENMPNYRSLKNRLIDFKDDAIIFGLTKVLQAVRAIVWSMGKIFGGEAEKTAQKFLAEHNIK